MNITPVLICIDVEPDAREVDVDARADWEGFEESFRLFEELRPRAEDAAGIPARFSWFLRMDPQVALAYGSAAWAAERYGAQLERLRGVGDELGLHTHAWRRVGGRWVTDNGDQTWVNHCVRLSFQSYERAFGQPCLSFRFGDHWMNEETFELVERLGARYELTLEPGRRAAPGLANGETYTGAFPDCTRIPRAPPTAPRAGTSGGRAGAAAGGDSGRFPSAQPSSRPGRRPPICGAPSGVRGTAEGTAPPSRSRSTRRTSDGWSGTSSEGRPPTSAW